MSHKHTLSLKVIEIEIDIKAQGQTTIQTMRDLLTITIIITTQIHMEAEQTFKIVTIGQPHKPCRSSSNPSSIKILKNIKIILHLSRKMHKINTINITNIITNLVTNLRTNIVSLCKEMIPAKGKRQCKELRKDQEDIDKINFFV